MKKVRYAVVGSGWISQIAFMPGVAQTGNSEMTAIVTGNREGAGKLARFHGIEHVVGYEEYDALLAKGLVDAVYIALPNSMHADYAIRAARAGVHALVEKPLAVSVAECQAMIAAADKAGTWLSTAYRLHNEPATIEVLDLIRNGAIGDPRYFNSTFSFQAGLGNHRLKAEHWGGSLQDIGVYCMNAARHVFSSEPSEAVALSAAGVGDPRFTEVPEVYAALLRFPGERLAHFTCSFGADPIDLYKVVGSTGQIEVSPGYRFETALSYRLTRDGKVIEKTFPAYDHFSGMTHYFSECILNGQRPEPDGEDGLADVRALLAIEAAALTGQAQKIVTPPKAHYPTPAMARSFPPVERRLML